MSGGKSQYLGSFLSGADTGALETKTVGAMRFTVLTTVGSVPVTGLLVANLPSDAMLNEINVVLRAAIPGEASLRFGTGAGGSDNIGSVSISGAAKYTAFQAVATAQTTLPFGKAGISAGVTPIYFSTGAVSGAVTVLGTDGMIEVVYTRLPYGENPSISPAHKANNTRFLGPVRTGKDDGTGRAGLWGHALFSQMTTASTAPVTGQIVAVLPMGAALSELNVHVKTAAAGEGTARFTIGSAAGGDTLGRVSISGARVYSVSLGTAFATLPYGVNNTGSAVPVYFSIVATSGSVSAVAAVSEVVYARLGQDSGYPGVGQKATGFSRGIATGMRLGAGDAQPGVGWARFMQLTTVAPAAGGVTSAQRVGVLPAGAALLEANFILRAAVDGEARVRFTTTNDFGSDNLGLTSASAAGKYSILGTTARTTIAGGVNNTGNDIVLYLSTLALSGSISPISANAVFEMIYARLDPVRFGGG